MSKRLIFPKVGVSIVTYNSSKYIRGCLSSVFMNNYPNLTCVVVDNASVDESVKIIDQNFPKAFIIKNKTNKGFAAAHNQAIAYFLQSKTDYVLLLNPDAVVKPSLIQELVTILQENPATAVVGPIIVYAKDPQKIWFAGGKFNRFFCYSKHQHINEPLNSQHIQSKPVDFITGACMMIRADVLRKVGFLPEQYFLYFEDVFFCQKIRSYGFKCMLLAKPLVRHFVSSSAGKVGENILTPTRAYYFARNPLMYIRKELKGIDKFTGFLGQIFIRLPYYMYRMTLDKAFSSITFYLHGFIDGLKSKQIMKPHSLTDSGKSSRGNGGKAT